MKDCLRIMSLMLLGSFGITVYSQTNYPPANWRLIGSPSPGATAYLDWSSIAPEGTYKKIWSLTSYPAARPVPGQPTKMFLSVTALHWVDCPSHTFSNPQKVYYDEAFGGGNSVYSYNLANVPFQDAVPGSVGATIVQTACGGK